MIEQRKFEARFEKARAAGLVDMKFMVQNGDALSTEDFFGSLNKIEDAIEAGNCRRQTMWDDPVPQHSELFCN